VVYVLWYSFHSNLFPLYLLVSPWSHSTICPIWNFPPGTQYELHRPFMNVQALVLANYVSQVRANSSNQHIRKAVCAIPFGVQCTSFLYHRHAMVLKPSSRFDEVSMTLPSCPEIVGAAKPIFEDSVFARHVRLGLEIHSCEHNLPLANENWATCSMSHALPQAKFW